MQLAKIRTGLHLIHGSLEVIAAVLLSVAATSSIMLLPDGHLLRVTLALMLILILPGFAVTALVFPRGDTGDNIDAITLVIYSIGGSIALCAIGGLALHLTPVGLTDLSWLIFLNGLIWIASFGALIRRAADRENLTNSMSKLRESAGPVTLTAAVAVAVVVGSVSIARNGVIQQPTAPFTQLWLQPADSVPMSADRSRNTGLTIGVLNKEQQFMRYTLIVTDPGGSTLDTTEIALDAGQTWQKTIVLASVLPSDGTLTAQLYRSSDQDHQVYRRVTFDLSSSANR